MRPGQQPNLQQLMKQAQKMQQQMLTAQEELGRMEVTGTAGGGMVSATTTGTGEIVSLKIDRRAVDPEEVESLEDLVVAALRDAHRAAKQLAEERLGPLGGAAGGLLGG